MMTGTASSSSYTLRNGVGFLNSHLEGRVEPKTKGKTIEKISKTARALPILPIIFVLVSWGLGQGENTAPA